VPRCASSTEANRSFGQPSGDQAATDLYQIHRLGPTTPVEETMQALHEVVAAGKARYLGASSMFCERCARELPLVCGLCRFCHIVLSAQPDGAPASEQLWLEPGLPRS
jgi:hypothetical protein